MNLFLVARHGDVLASFAADLRQTHGVTVETAVLDLSETEAVVYFADVLFGERDDFGLLVYNAAYTGAAAGLFTSDSLDMALTAVDVNVRGVLGLVHPFLRARQRQQAQRDAAPEDRATGGVVLMSSMAGLVGSAHISVYAATKAWNTAFATGLYEEWRERGVDVLACVAGATTTPNYLESALPTRSRAVEQLPAAVVAECAAALGRAPTRATGLINRMGQLALGRLLPTRLAVAILGDQLRKTTRFERVEETGGVHAGGVE